MTEEKIAKLLAAKLDEMTELVPGLDAMALIVSTSDQEDGSTSLISMIRGNRHCCRGAVREWIVQEEAYEKGYHSENGRYDAVVIRQQNQ
jgi:hypothetical protein